MIRQAKHMCLPSYQSCQEVIILVAISEVLISFKPVDADTSLNLWSTNTIAIAPATVGNAIETIRVLWPQEDVGVSIWPFTTGNFLCNNVTKFTVTFKTLWLCWNGMWPIEPTLCSVRWCGWSCESVWWAAWPNQTWLPMMNEHSRSSSDWKLQWFFHWPGSHILSWSIHRQQIGCETLRIKWNISIFKEAAMLDLRGNILLESFWHCRLTIIVVFIDPHHPLQRVHSLLQIWLVIEVIFTIL